MDDYQNQKYLRYSELVPKRYLQSSGLTIANLKVIDAWHRPFKYVLNHKGLAVPIRPAALCELELPEGPTAFLIDIEDLPQLAEAVLLLGQLFFTGNRIQRYLTLYKMYEILEPKPDLEFAAVRHGLSHPSSSLSRPKTKAKLNELFGTTKIDLSISKHTRIFYQQMILLLSETDKKLFNSVLAHRDVLRRLRSRQHALHEWQVYGIEGIVKPIPVHESIDLES